MQQNQLIFALFNDQGQPWLSSTFRGIPSLKDFQKFTKLDSEWYIYKNIPHPVSSSQPRKVPGPINLPP